MVLTLRQTLRKLEAASHSNKVKLTELEISRLPDLSFLAHVTSLDLSSNAFLFVPEQLSALKKLEFLNLSNNSISGFSVNVIASLKSLKVLLLSSNHIVQLEDRCFPDSLIELSVCRNRLVEFQEALVIPSLRRLDVSFNQIRGLPASVATMTNLEELNLVCLMRFCTEL